MHMAFRISSRATSMESKLNEMTTDLRTLLISQKYLNYKDKTSIVL